MLFRGTSEAGQLTNKFSSFRDPSNKGRQIIFV